MKAKIYSKKKEKARKSVKPNKPKIINLNQKQ